MHLFCYDIWLVSVPKLSMKDFKRDFEAVEVCIIDLQNTLIRKRLERATKRYRKSSILSDNRLPPVYVIIFCKRQELKDNFYKEKLGKGFFHCPTVEESYKCC